MNEKRSTRRKHTVVLLALAAGMFGFAFALVPLYATFCELTGLNGRTSNRVVPVESVAPVTDREVTIQFLAQVGNGMPWEFRPMESELHVRLGEIYTTRFYAHNRATTAVTARAVPSVAPSVAAPHLRKIECFCFTQQRLSAGQEIEMPVRFYVAADLPQTVHTLTLSYTMFPAMYPTPEESGS